MTAAVNGNPNHETRRTETIAQNLEPDLAPLCAKVHARITAFLDAEPATDRLRKVQEQTRLSLKIIDEALDRYRWDMLCTDILD